MLSATKKKRKKKNKRDTSNKLSTVLASPILRHLSERDHYPFLNLQIAGFNGLSDALKRLDFLSAVHDCRRFNYIVRLLDLLVSHRMGGLSGCAQRVLFNMLEEVALEGKRISLVYFEINSSKIVRFREYTFPKEMLLVLNLCVDYL